MPSHRIPWELVVLFSFAVFFLHESSLGMTLDKASLLLLWCNCSSSSYSLCLSFQDSPCVGGHYHTTKNKGAPCSWPKHGQSFDSCTSVWWVWYLYTSNLDDNMARIILLHHLVPKQRQFPLVLLFQLSADTSHYSYDLLLNIYNQHRPEAVVSTEIQFQLLLLIFLMPNYIGKFMAIKHLLVFDNKPPILWCVCHDHR